MPLATELPAAAEELTYETCEVGQVVWSTTRGGWAGTVLRYWPQAFGRKEAAASVEDFDADGSQVLRFVWMHYLHRLPGPADRSAGLRYGSDDE